MTDPADLTIVEMDVYAMRRKTVHQVTSPTGEPLSHHQTLAGLFSWLHENDHNQFVLLDDTAAYLVDFRLSPHHT